MTKSKLFFSLAFLVLFASCVRRFSYSTYKNEMVTEVGKMYVLKNNGEKVFTKTIDFSTKGGQDFIKLDADKIPVTDVIGYQTTKGFYKKLVTKRNGVLGGSSIVYEWAAQIKKGKINLYYFESGGGANGAGSTDNYVFEKGGGGMHIYSIDGIAQILEDNKPAHDKFISTFKRMGQLEKKPKALLEIIDLYNNN